MATESELRQLVLNSSANRATIWGSSKSRQWKHII